MVEFNHVGEGLKSSDGMPLRHFEICSNDGVFHSASARILGSNRVAVSHPDVSHPTHVRFNWLAYPNPSANLVNSADLPASPFTTE